MIDVSHFGFLLRTGMLACAGHTPVFPGHLVVGVGAVRVTLVGRCHRPWVI